MGNGAVNGQSSAIAMKQSITTSNIRRSKPWMRLMFWERKQGKQTFQIQKGCMTMWNAYLSNSNSNDHNVFSPLLIEEEKAFRDAFEIYGRPVEIDMHFARHLHLVHFAIDQCLRMIINGEFNDCVFTLYSLGAIHADMGIQPVLMSKFIKSALSVISATSATTGASADVIEQVLSSSGSATNKQELDMLKDSLTAIVQSIINGMKNHNRKVDVVFTPRKHWYSQKCWVFEKRKLRYINKRSHLSIYNMSMHLSQDD